MIPYRNIILLAGLPGVARDGERRNRIEMLCIVQQKRGTE